ncbi:MAG: choice-of-anchor D domain-containing protein [Vitreoscilla sp.]
MRFLILAVGLALAAANAHAQNAANGKSLYTGAVVTGKQSCSNSACHGSLPANAQNRIGNGIAAGTIKSALGSTSQMNFLSGHLSNSQLNDLASYIAASLGGTPTYLQVTAAPNPQVMPAALTFAAQSLQATGAAQSVTVSNAAGATAPLVLGTPSVTAGGDFAISGGTCVAGASLAAGASCTIGVAFKATVVGTRSGTLTVAHNGSGGASTVSLTGTGVDNSPAISVSPSQLSFTQTVGSASDPLRVTIGNNGTAALVLSSIALSGANAADYSISAASTCSTGASVMSASNCFVELRFTPSAAGVRTASLVIQHNAGTGSSNVSLSGQGNATAQPGVVLDTTLLDLGAQGLGTTGGARTLTVANNGQADLRFTSIAAGGADAADIVLGGTCAVAVPVAPKASCSVTAALHPGALGARSATLALATNAPVGTVDVSLTGEGIASPAPALTLSQPSLGFGMVTIGTTSVARKITVGNSGSANLTISAIQSSSGEFKLTHDCPAGLAPGASCTVSVTYTPVSANSAESVVITSNAFSSPNSIVVTGLGTTTVLPVLAWRDAPSSIAFATVDVGESVDAKPLTLVNNGPGSVTVSAIGTAGADADAFSVGGGTCIGGIVLAVGDSCTVVATFTPDATGMRNAVLLVASTGSNPPDIPLTGGGASGSTGGGGDAPGGGGSGGTGAGGGTLSAMPGVLDFRTAVVRSGGRSDPLTVRISNTSATDATIASVTTTDSFVVQSANATDACPGVPWTLAPGASCTVAITFVPSTGGTTSGTLHVLSAGGQASDIQLSAEAQTVMTNQGGGAIDPWLLLLLAGACAGLGRARCGAPDLADRGTA